MVLPTRDGNPISKRSADNSEDPEDAERLLAQLSPGMNIFQNLRYPLLCVFLEFQVVRENSDFSAADIAVLRGLPGRDGRDGRDCAFSVSDVVDIVMAKINSTHSLDGSENAGTSGIVYLYIGELVDAEHPVPM